MSKLDDFLRFEGTDGYIASPSLVDAVNAAIALERPLLIKGEPGTGKTLLAEHVAGGLGLPLEKWHIKSTSKAQEGLYVYDTVQRLNDARFGDGDVSDIRAYIKLGPMGRTFASERQHVLLIDEVDKADLEFPNDLLRELDEMRFTIMETSDEIVTFWDMMPTFAEIAGTEAPSDIDGISVVDALAGGRITAKRT